MFIVGSVLVRWLYQAAVFTGISESMNMRDFEGAFILQSGLKSARQIKV